MARLELKNVSKRFGKDVSVACDVSFSVEEGEFLTLLGPSGCGKTTLLRIIAGLESPDAGSIFIDGRDVTAASPAERNVAMVFQSYALYPHMRVFDNIAVGLKLKKVQKEKIQCKVNRVAESLEIRTLLNRLPKELSGGQRQRVALARALVRDPRVFLLDEPLSNLDAVLRERTRAELKLLFSRIGGTVVYVTHDQVEAMSMSRRIVLLKDGQIQQIGSPEEIYTNPTNRFVAGFVGSPSISFVDAKIENGLLKFGDCRAEVKEPGLTNVGAVVIGIRPEDVEVVPEAGVAGKANASILLVEPFGSFAVATLELSGVRIKALLSPNSVAVGMAVSFSLKQEKIHLFDPATGCSLRAKKGVGEYR
jgi:multiple sugar transport system ATP-binding protein